MRKKLLFVVPLLATFFLYGYGQNKHKNLFIQSSARSETFAGKNGETIFAFRTLGAIRNKASFDVSHSWGKKHVWSFGFGYPIWMTDEEKSQMIFLPMIYKHWGAFNGIGLGININYEYKKFFWISSHQIAIGKKGVNEFYGPNIAATGAQLNKHLFVGAEFEVLASTDETPGVQSVLSSETFLGPLLRWRQPIAKKYHRTLWIETSYGLNITGDKNKFLLSLIIE